MTFRKKFHKSSKWHERAAIVEIFHLRQSHIEKKWTMQRTAKYFNVSLGFISESLKLARACYEDPTFINCANRQIALNHLKRRGYNQTNRLASEQETGKMP